MPAPFDFDAYKRAFCEKDVEPWLDFYADDAEWIAYKPMAPPRSPEVMRGREQIAGFLRGIASSDVRLTISNEVIGAEGAAFQVTVDVGGGRQIIENVIVELREGQIVRQVDVEAWD